MKPTPLSFCIFLFYDFNLNFCVFVCLFVNWMIVNLRCFLYEIHRATIAAKHCGHEYKSAGYPTGYTKTCNAAKSNPSTTIAGTAINASSANCQHAESGNWIVANKKSKFKYLYKLALLQAYLRNQLHVVCLSINHFELNHHNPFPAFKLLTHNILQTTFKCNASVVLVYRFYLSFDLDRRTSGFCHLLEYWIASKIYFKI